MSYTYDLQHGQSHIRLQYHIYRTGYDSDIIRYEIKSPYQRWMLKSIIYKMEANQTFYHHNQSGSHDAGDNFHTMDFFLDDLYKIDLDDEDAVKRFCLLKVQHSNEHIRLICKKILEGYKIWWVK